MVITLHHKPPSVVSQTNKWKLFIGWPLNKHVCSSQSMDEHIYIYRESEEGLQLQSQWSHVKALFTWKLVLTEGRCSTFLWSFMQTWKNCKIRKPFLMSFRRWEHRCWSWSLGLWFPPLQPQHWTPHVSKLRNKQKRCVCVWTCEFIITRTLFFLTWRVGHWCSRRE